MQGSPVAQQSDCDAPFLAAGTHSLDTLPLSSQPTKVQEQAPSLLLPPAASDSSRQPAGVTLFALSSTSQPGSCALNSRSARTAAGKHWAIGCESVFQGRCAVASAGQGRAAAAAARAAPSPPASSACWAPAVITAPAAASSSAARSRSAACSSTRGVALHLINISGGRHRSIGRPVRGRAVFIISTE